MERRKCTRRWRRRRRQRAEPSLSIRAMRKLSVLTLEIAHFTMLDHRRLMQRGVLIDGAQADFEWWLGKRFRRRGDGG